MTGRFFGVGSIESLGAIGIRLTEDGTLDFDESKLHAQFQRDPESLKAFFTDEDNGAVCGPLGRRTAPVRVSL